MRDAQWAYVEPETVVELFFSEPMLQVAFTLLRVEVLSRTPRWTGFVSHEVTSSFSSNFVLNSYLPVCCAQVAGRRVELHGVAPSAASAMPDTVPSASARSKLN